MFGCNFQNFQLFWNFLVFFLLSFQSYLIDINHLTLFLRNDYIYTFKISEDNLINKFDKGKIHVKGKWFLGFETIGSVPHSTFHQINDIFI